jgi:hypothetical protein
VSLHAVDGRRRLLRCDEFVGYRRGEHLSNPP